MTDDQFWKILQSACESDPSAAEDWDQRLVEKLSELPEEEIIQWNHVLNRLAAQAYRSDLWAAAYLINGGASDDGFYYFRLWLIGMGKKIYQAAIADPDSLVDVVDPNWLEEGIDAEAEIYGAGFQAWLKVTGNPDTADYPARNERATLEGEMWDFDDDALMQTRLPKLHALYQ